MTQKVDSGALTLQNKAYGIVGPGSPETIINDGNVEQVIPANLSARRGLSPFMRSLFFQRHEHTHSGAGEEVSTIDVYAPANSNNGWVDPPINDFDIWLLGASSFTTVGANATWGMLSQGRLASNTGATSDEAGGAVSLADIIQPLLAWQEYGTIGAVSPGAVGSEGVTGIGPLYLVPQGGPLRLDRGGTIICRSEVTGAAQVDFIVSLGIFPVTLGQDGTG